MSVVRTAFVVVDSQVMFCCGTKVEPSDKVEHFELPHFKVALDNIAVARGYFDQIGIPSMLVYTTDAFGVEDPSVYKDDPYQRFHRQRLNGLFHVVCKTEDSAFDYVEHLEFISIRSRKLPSDLKTQLDNFYPRAKNLVISGFNTGACVKKTVKDAIALGYRVYVPLHCTRDADDHGEEGKARPIEEAALGDIRRYGAWVGTLNQLKEIMETPGNDLLSSPAPKTKYGVFTLPRLTGAR